MSVAEAITVRADDFALTREDADAMGDSMKKVAVEKSRDSDFSGGKRGPIVKPEPGKTKISIRWTTLSWNTSGT